MRGDQLARQWRILGVIESPKHGATVAGLAAHEGCHELGTPNSKPETGPMTMEVGGLCEVMNWVMGVAEVVPEGAMSFRLEHFERFERLERAPRSNSYIALSLSCCFLG